MIAQHTKDFWLMIRNFIWNASNEVPVQEVMGQLAESANGRSGNGPLVELAATNLLHLEQYEAEWEMLQWFLIHPDLNESEANYAFETITFCANGVLDGSLIEAPYIEWGSGPAWVEYRKAD